MTSSWMRAGRKQANLEFKSTEAGSRYSAEGSASERSPEKHLGNDLGIQLHGLKDLSRAHLHVK